MAPYILNPYSGWRWVVAFTPQQLTLSEKAVVMHSVGDYFGPRADLAILRRGKYFASARN
jgi:hypothetical protein